MPIDTDSVSLVLTVLNERSSLERLLRGIEVNLEAIDEIVIVDGGSEDGTWEFLHTWSKTCEIDCLLIRRRGAGRSEGRNIGIAHASGSLILVTDAGCLARPGWAKSLASALLGDRVVAAKGAYIGHGRRPFGKAVASVLVNDLASLSRSDALASSRSFAFKKSAWESVGGYPEWLTTAEDTLFAQRIGEIGDTPFVPEAVVEWEVRDTPIALAKQYFAYARGDALARTNTRRHVLVMGFYTVTVLWLILGPTRVVPLAMQAAYLLKRARWGKRLQGSRPWEVPLAFLAIWVSDLASAFGYGLGLLEISIEQRGR